MSNLKVTLAYPFTGPDGVEHRADSTISLPRHEANRLLAAGLARTPDPTAAKKTATRKTAAKSAPSAPVKEN